MESEARYTWVGAAVLVLLAGLLTALLWLRNSGSGGNFNHYAIHFEKQALDGLDVGADVTLRGIRVGRVEDYTLPGEKLNLVRVQIRVDRRAVLRTHTVAVVTRNFVTGIAAITLVHGSPPGEPLNEVPEGETLPVIGEGRSDVQEIAGQVNKVGEMATIAIGNLNQLLATENRDAFMATVRSLREVADGINQRLTALDSALNRVGEAASKTSVAMANVGTAATGVGTAAATLAQAGERVVRVAESSGHQLDTTLAETQRAVADAQRAFVRIAAASETLQQQALATAGRLERSAANIDDQFSAAVTELRVSVETGARLLDRLREPRAALLGPSPAQMGPGEKTP